MAQDNYNVNGIAEGDDAEARRRQQQNGQPPPTDPNAQGQPTGAKDQNYWNSQIDPELLKQGGGFQANDVDNINKYGLDPFVAELQKRAGSQRTGDGESAPMQPSAAQPQAPAWYDQWFETQRNQQAAAEAERKQRADQLYSTWL